MRVGRLKLSRTMVRTDLQGYSENEQVLVILENKFWAGLTDNQPTTYLDLLSGPEGTLAFVAPSTRLTLLTHQLDLRLRAREERANFERVGDSHVAHLSSGKTLVVTSWSALLDAIGKAMETAEEYDNLADLRQLQTLAGKMENEGFRPFTVGDLTGDSPRLILRLCNLVDGAVEQLLTRGFADKKGLKASAGAGYYGHYFRLHGFICQLAMTAKLWSTKGVSPIWFRVLTKEPRRLLSELLLKSKSTGFDPGDLIEDRDGPGLWIPIRLAEGRERDAVLQDIAQQIDVIAAVLRDQPGAGVEVPVPDQVPG